MVFMREGAQVFVPDGSPAAPALRRTTHLGIGAHPDDLEIMAIDGILRCFQQPDRAFTGVVLTDGSGSPREGRYRDCSDAQMRALRIEEQKKAAVAGAYAALLLLDYPSAVVKDQANVGPAADLLALFEMVHPEVVYTHSLADHHATHVATALRVIAALRAMPEARRPQHLYGCEVWRDLDWLTDADKVVFDCSAHILLQETLLGLFDSQICGGKRYDLATMGRRRAHATYLASHGVDTLRGAAFAMDLTPLIQDPSLDIPAYVRGFIDRFSGEVCAGLTTHAAS